MNSGFFALRFDTRKGFCVPAKGGHAESRKDVSEPQARHVPLD